MRISLIYELQMAKPWHNLSEYNTYWQAIAQIELAEEMGFHGVWCVEHHFLTEYSHSSAPEVFFGAISQRTQRIRLGARRRVVAPPLQPSRARGGARGRSRHSLQRTR